MGAAPAKVIPRGCDGARVMLSPLADPNEEVPMRRIMTALVAVAFLGCGGALNETTEAQAPGPAVAKQAQAVSGHPQDPMPPTQTSDTMSNDSIEEAPLWPPAENLFRLTKDRAEEHFYHPVDLHVPTVTRDRPCPACECPFCT